MPEKEWKEYLKHFPLIFSVITTQAGIPYPVSLVDHLARLPGEEVILRGAVHVVAADRGFVGTGDHLHLGAEDGWGLRHPLGSGTAHLGSKSRYCHIVIRNAGLTSILVLNVKIYKFQK